MRTMQRRSFTVAIALAAALGLPFAGAASAASDEKITYLFPAPGFLPAFAPFQIAMGKGYYKDAGLDVTFGRARGGVDVAKQVGVGNADLGGGIGDSPIIVRANGVPVRSVALLGGMSLMSLAVHKDAGITSPKDLMGKTVAVSTFADTTYYNLLGMLAKFGLTRNDLDLQAVGFGGVVKTFVSRKAVAMAAVPEWIEYAIAGGAKVDVYPATEYFGGMAQAILASDEGIRKRPKAIGGFVKATLRALRYVMDDPAKAAADYVTIVPRHKGKEAQITRILARYASTVYPGQKVLGAMDRAKLAALQDFYVAQGIVRKKTPVGELYTNQFVGAGS
jgi:NitT/TauT family transport system substrate-binding protein